jgi:rhodanese-related sulfurtransferase/rubrerythrin
MKIADIFSWVKLVNVNEAKKLIEEKKEGEVALIDVREPEEYENGHLPGAQLVPLSSLLEKLQGLNPSKTTVTYCRSGSRSRSAAALMKTKGFREVYSLEGGVLAWKGLVATGGYEAGLFLLEGRETVEELISLAWSLEDGTRMFYEQARDVVSDADAKQVFTSLIKAEQKHKENLLNAYRQLRGGDISEEQLMKDTAKGYMESGIVVQEALSWLKDKEGELQDVLEFSMQIETNSLDLYSKILSQTGDEKVKNVFHVLIEDEKIHLSRLGRLLGSTIKNQG